MKYLAVRHILAIHQRVVAKTGGTPPVLNVDQVDSAVAQPRMAFGGQDLYPSIAEKAAALAFSLSLNHPFQDGNKRTAFMSMWMFLSRNGYRLNATIDESETAFIGIASGEWGREMFTDWVRERVVPK